MEACFQRRTHRIGDGVGEQWRPLVEAAEDQLTDHQAEVNVEGGEAQLVGNFALECNSRKLAGLRVARLHNIFERSSVANQRTAVRATRSGTMMERLTESENNRVLCCKCKSQANFHPFI